jgi:hypothetical protein
MAYGYKLVQYDKWGHPHSAYTLGRVIRYHLRKPTFPHKGDGPLAVFEDYPSAKIFQEIFSFAFPLRLFKCHFNLSRGTSLWAKGKGTSRLTRLRSRTRCATSVTLLYEVK